MSLPAGWKIVPGSIPIESGQAWVYRVRRNHDDRVYALKRLKKPGRGARFRREVETVRRLAEIGLPVPPVITEDLTDKKPWFTLPWFDLGSLEELLQETAEEVDIVARLRLVDRVAMAISRLHEARVAHRDIKPANVLRSEDGVVLADFGLCLSIDDDVRLTATNEAVGPRLYIAPENESGISDEVDQRPADCYAWAKLAWAVVAGKAPPARELQLETENHLDLILDDSRLVGLHPLFRRLLETDPRVRLTDWIIIRNELSAVLNLFDSSAQPAVLEKIDYAAALSAVSRIAADRRADERKWREERLNRNRVHADEIGQAISQELHRTLTADFSRFDLAGEGEMTFAVSSAGFPLSELLEFNVLYLDQPNIEAFSLEATSPALASIAWSSPSDPGKASSHLYIGIYVLVVGDFFRLLRVPVLYRPSERVSFDLTPGSFELSELYPLGLATSLNSAEAFARETATISLRVAITCIHLIDDGEDPFDRSAWSQ